MTLVVRIHEYGGPEVLRLEELDLGDPGPGEVLIRQTAIGLNYRDTMLRTGQHKVRGFPARLGLEGAGVIESVGDGVTEFAPGQRVVAASGPDGSNAEMRIMPASRVIALPDSIDDRTAAAMMIRGMTARNLLKRTYPVQPGDTILVHASAGGLGLILCQWAKALGATVIGTVGSEAKADLAKSAGCDHVIVGGDFAPQVRKITGGEGVPVVYDSVGRDTFEGSLDSLRPLGVMVSYGEASGDPPAISPRELGYRGSLYLTHPSLHYFLPDREALLRSANDLFDVVAAGDVQIRINQTYPLHEVARAHADMGARRTTGSTILLP